MEAPDQNPNPERSKREVQVELDAIEAFMTSPAYSRWVSHIQGAIQMQGGVIASIPPRNIEETLLQHQNYGRLQSLIESLNDFEVARENLKQELNQLMDGSSTQSHV